MSDIQLTGMCVCVLLCVVHFLLLLRKFTSLSVSLSLCFNGHFPGEPGLARCLLKQRMMEMVVTTGAISRAKLQSNHHHPQTNIQFFYRPDALPVAQPTVSKHWGEKYHIPRTCLPQAHLQLCLRPLTENLHLVFSIWYNNNRPSLDCACRMLQVTIIPMSSQLRPGSLGNSGIWRTTGARFFAGWSAWAFWYLFNSVRALKVTTVMEQNGNKRKPCCYYNSKINHLAINCNCYRTDRKLW